jgi:diguanylate cyclase (GGDEF)-like protein
MPAPKDTASPADPPDRPGLTEGRPKRVWAKRWQNWWRVAAMLVGGLVVWVGIYHLLAGNPDRTAVWQSIVLPTAILTLVLLVAIRHEVVWARPTRRMLELIRAVRAGEAPIDELTDVKGGPVELVQLVQGLLRELRQQRQDYLVLEAEMKTRVERRTDALERKLGSLREQASRDALTGLRNRRSLEDLLEPVYDDCVQRGIDLALLMIDVDYFKQLNDTLGHAKGDELLRTIGQLIRSTVREGDYAFRYGGDEFIVLMPGTGPVAGESLAKRLESLVDGLVKPMRLPKPPHLSIGVSCRLAEPTSCGGDLMTRADMVLYQRKSHRKRAA